MNIKKDRSRGVLTYVLLADGVLKNLSIYKGNQVHTK